LVAKLLEALDPKDRLLIQWLELEDRPVNEVAALTGWSRTLVKVRAFRARRKMRQTLDRIMGRDKP
jgi:RNA polymerase sigma-70 factor (ECF subfamily)